MEKVGQVFMTNIGQIRHKFKENYPGPSQVSASLSCFMSLMTPHSLFSSLCIRVL